MKTKKWMTATIAMVCMVLLNSCSYNKMVEKDEAVSTAWSNVETQYPVSYTHLTLPTNSLV